jgi:hypothetical protein
MSPVKYRTIIRYLLMIPLFPIDEVCPVCPTTCMNTFGEHEVHCKELSDFEYTHDFVKNVLFDIFRRTRILVKKETPMNFLTDPLDKRSTCRCVDVMV